MTEQLYVVTDSDIDNQFIAKDIQAIYTRLEELHGGELDYKESSNSEKYFIIYWTDNLGEGIKYFCQLSEVYV